MKPFHPRRIWFWIALAAIVIAVIALLLPHHGNTTHQQTLLAILPVFFVGLIAAFRLPPRPAVLSIGHAPAAPTLAPTFQRPPPSRLE